MGKNYIISADFDNKLCSVIKGDAVEYFGSLTEEGNVIHISTDEGCYDKTRMAALKVNAKSGNKAVVVAVKAASAQASALIAELIEMKENGARFSEVYERSLKPLQKAERPPLSVGVKKKAKA